MQGQGSGERIADAGMQREEKRDAASASLCSEPCMGSARARLSKSVHQRSLGAGPWTRASPSPSAVSLCFMRGLLPVGWLLPTITHDRPVVPYLWAAALLFEPLHRIGLTCKL